MVLVSVLSSIGCGGGGSGSSGDGTATIASAPVDLPPGQTSAVMAWKPSEGPVEGYMVFQSNREEPFAYRGYVAEPKIVVTGSPGDSIRLFVVARSVNGTQSTASPPSPPVRFHAAATAVATTAAATARTASATAAALGTTATADAATVQPTGSDPANGQDAANTSAEQNAGAVVLLDSMLRERLLRANPRLPLGELGSEASRWIQSFVDEQVAAGVSLAGTGERSGDAFRELIWKDPYGQIFVSDGARLVTTDDVPDTFVEAIRFRPTERFVALADFDGDGIGEWLIEDLVTGEVWIAPGGTADPEFTLVTGPARDARILGQGDFDADGRAELLWQDTDRTLRLGRPGSSLPAIEWLSSNPGALDASHLLGVADLNGDGRDDLLFATDDGRLQLAFAEAGQAGVAFAWEATLDRDMSGLELLATLDFDADGAAEIAWWSEDGVQLWDVQDGF